MAQYLSASQERLNNTLRRRGLGWAIVAEGSPLGQKGRTGVISLWLRKGLSADNPFRLRIDYPGLAAGWEAGWAACAGALFGAACCMIGCPAAAPGLGMGGV